MNAPLQKNEKLHRFEDGDETVSVRVTEWTNRTFTAVEVENLDVAGVIGSGFTSLGAIADLFERLPRARSEREERDDLAAKFDAAQDNRKNWVGS